MRLSEPQKGKENRRCEEPRVCRCSRHFIVEVALPTSIGSGMEKEQGKQVELGRYLGMVGITLPQEGSHDLSVRPYFPAEMLASCSQIYFFHRSCKPRIPREISPFLNGGKEFHFQEKKCGDKHYILKYRYVWTGQPWIEICCLACISISLYSFPIYPLISPLAPRAPQTNFWWQSAFYCTESFHGHIGIHTCQEGTRAHCLGTLSTQLVTGI